MSGEDLKAKVRRLVEEGWNKGNMAAFDEICAANVVYHHPTFPQKDREGLKAFCNTLRSMAPDIHITIDDLMAAEGDKVVVRVTERFTDTVGAPERGLAPTGKQLAIECMMIYQFAGGKVVEEWEQVDMAGMQKQQQA
jgi:predicted ester cyclase